MGELRALAESHRVLSGEFALASRRSNSGLNGTTPPKTNSNDFSQRYWSVARECGTSFLRLRILHVTPFPTGVGNQLASLDSRPVAHIDDRESLQDNPTPPD